MIVNFDHEAVRPDCHTGARQRRDHVGVAAAVRWINDHWQMGNAANRRDRREIEGITRVLRERSHASFA